MIAFLAACAPAVVLDDLGPLPPFSLTAQDGAVVSRDTFAGHVVVADFFFTTCPDVCPLLSAHMAEVATRYATADDVRLVSITVDPATDTPGVLATYGARYGAVPDRWYFLTGPVDTVKAVVVEGFKQAMVPSAAGGVLHGERFVLVDKRGHLRGFPDPKEPGKKAIWAGVEALRRE